VDLAFRRRTSIQHVILKSGLKKALLIFGLFGPLTDKRRKIANIFDPNFRARSRFSPNPRFESISFFLGAVVYSKWGGLRAQIY